MEAFKRCLTFLKPAFRYERTVCRLLASWLAFCATMLMLSGSFTDLAYLQGVPLWLFVLCVSFFFLLYTVVAALLPSYESDSILLLLGATLSLLLWIPNSPRFLFALAAFVPYVLCLFYVYRKNEALLSGLRLSSKTAVILSALFAFLGVTVLSLIGIFRYLSFSTPNFDFGLFCNMFHYMKETGLPLVTSERDGLLSHFAVHISPIYYLLLPFYYLFPSPITLQIGQAAVLYIGLIPLLLLCRHFKLSPKITLTLAFLYTFYPALSTGCFYDLHENCFLTPLLLFTFYFYEKKKTLPTFFFAFLVLMVKEDAAVYLCVFALYILLSNRKRWKTGLSMLLFALCYFALALTLLSRFGEGAMINRFDNLIFNKEEGLLGALRTALYNPGYLLTQLLTDASGGWGKVLYLFELLLPLAFLPFCTKRPSRWLLLSPLLINLLSMYQYQYDIGFQYSFGITAFLFYATVSNLGERRENAAPRRLLPLAAAACLCFYLFTAFPTLGTYAGMYRDNRADYIQMEEALDALPSDAALSVSTMLLAHVADRDTVYEIDYHGNAADVDYVVFDLRYTSQSELLTRKTAYFRMGYTVHQEIDGLLLILAKGQ